MQPIDIHISNHVNLKLDKLQDEKKEKHLIKAQNIANLIIYAQDQGKKAVTVKTTGYKKQLIKHILFDIMPEMTLRICSLIPGILRIVLI